MSRRNRRGPSRRAALGFAALALLALLYVSDRLNTPRPHVFADPRCAETYRNFFAKPEIDLRVAFGYKDARPARFVADRYERLVFVQTILAACAGAHQACGFARDPVADDVFVRRMPGPDGLPRTIRLRVVQPAVGPDDAENRDDPFQAWRTGYAERVFLGGLARADAVFYNGHSRAGGGPDFAPPRLLASDEVDFGPYRRERPGLTRVLDALGKPGTAVGSDLKLLGFFSCASSQHFVRQVNAAAPRLGTISSPELLYFADAMENLLGAVSGLLAFRCEPEFARGLAGDAPNETETRASSARISGFFR